MCCKCNWEVLTLVETNMHPVHAPKLQTFYKILLIERGLLEFIFIVSVA